MRVALPSAFTICGGTTTQRRIPIFPMRVVNVCHFIQVSDSSQRTQRPPPCNAGSGATGDAAGGVELGGVAFWPQPANRRETVRIVLMVVVFIKRSAAYGERSNAGPLTPDWNEDAL